MKPPPFVYHCPRTLEECLDLLSRLENAKLLAGGQSLMPMLNMRYVLPDHIVDLNRVKDLVYIREDSGCIAIGSMTRQRDVERSALVKTHLGILAEALQGVGHVQTRNRGTIGGSLCHLDPAAELPAIAMAYDAEIITASPRGRRNIPMNRFITSFMTPQIEADEIVTEVRFPFWAERHESAFEKFARRHGDFAIVAVAVLLSPDQDRLTRRASITIAGIGASPVRVTDAEVLLTGKMLDERTLKGAAQLCGDVDAMEDAYASGTYRRHLASVLSARALKRAYARFDHA